MGRMPKFLPQAPDFRPSSTPGQAFHGIWKAQTQKKVGVTNILSFTFLSYDRASINNHLHHGYHFLDHHECLLPGQDV
jgi:hypothetical protein